MNVYNKQSDFRNMAGAELAENLNAAYQVLSREASARKLDEASGEINRLPFYVSDQPIAEIQDTLGATAVQIVAAKDPDTNNAELYIVSKTKVIPLTKLLLEKGIVSINNVKGNTNGNVQLVGGNQVVIVADIDAHTITINIDGLVDTFNQFTVNTTTQLEALTNKNSDQDQEISSLQSQQTTNTNNLASLTQTVSTQGDQISQLETDVVGKVETIVATSPITASRTDGTVTLGFSGSQTGVTTLNGKSGAVSLVAGSNVTITPNPGFDSITIASTGGGSGGSATSIKDSQGNIASPDASDNITFNSANDGLSITADPATNSVEFNVESTASDDAPYTVWVDTTYQGSNSDGTVSKPFTTLQDGIDTAETSAQTSANQGQGVRWTVKTRPSSARVITEDVVVGKTIWNIEVVLENNYLEGRFDISCDPAFPISEDYSNIELKTYYAQPGNVRFIDLKNVPDGTDQQDTLTVRLGYKKLLPNYNGNTDPFVTFSTADVTTAGTAKQGALDLDIHIEDLVEPAPVGGNATSPIVLDYANGDTNFTNFALSVNVQIDSIDTTYSKGKVNTRADFVSFTEYASQSNTGMTVNLGFDVNAESASYHFSGLDKNSVSKSVRATANTAEGIQSSTITTNSLKAVNGAVTNLSVLGLFQLPLNNAGDSHTGDIYVDTSTNELKVVLTDGTKVLATKDDLPASQATFKSFTTNGADFRDYVEARKAVLPSFHAHAIDTTNRGLLVGSNTQTPIIARSEDVTTLTGDILEQQPAWEDFTPSASAIWSSWLDMPFDSAPQSVVLSQATTDNIQVYSLVITVNASAGNKTVEDYVDTFIPGNFISVVDQDQASVANKANRKRLEIMISSVTSSTSTVTISGYANIGHGQTNNEDIRPFATIAAFNAITSPQIRLGSQMMFEFGKGQSTEVDTKEHVMPQYYIVYLQTSTIATERAFFIYPFATRFATVPGSKANSAQFEFNKIPIFVLEQFAIKNNISPSDTSAIAVAILPYVLFGGIATGADVTTSFNSFLPFVYTETNNSLKMQLRIAPANDLYNIFSRFSQVGGILTTKQTYSNTGTLLENSGFLSCWVGNNLNIESMRVYPAVPSTANPTHDILSLNVNATDACTTVGDRFNGGLDMPINEIMNLNNLLFTSTSVEPTLQDLIQTTGNGANSHITVGEFSINTTPIEVKELIEKVKEIQIPIPATIPRISTTSEDMSDSNFHWIVLT